MVEINKMHERIETRAKILRDLYEHCFTNRGEVNDVSGEIGSNEVFLAYGYLKEKGYIEFDGKIARITAQGIDEIEEMEQGIEAISYVTKYIESSGHLKGDHERIDDVIRVYSEDYYVLHSVVPRISNGETEGYYIIFDGKNGI